MIRFEKTRNAGYTVTGNSFKTETSKVRSSGLTLMQQGLTSSLPTWDGAKNWDRSLLLVENRTIHNAWDPKINRLTTHCWTNLLLRGKPFYSKLVLGCRSSYYEGGNLQQHASGFN